MRPSPIQIRAELKIQSTLEAFEKERRKDVSRIEEICKQVLQEQQSQRGTLQDLNVTGSNPDTAKEIMIAMGRVSGSDLHPVY